MPIQPTRRIDECVLSPGERAVLVGYTNDSMTDIARNVIWHFNGRFIAAVGQMSAMATYAGLTRNVRLFSPMRGSTLNPVHIREVALDAASREPILLVFDTYEEISRYIDLDRYGYNPIQGKYNGNAEWEWMEDFFNFKELTPQIALLVLLPFSELGVNFSARLENLAEEVARVRTGELFPWWRHSLRAGEYGYAPEHRSGLLWIQHEKCGNVLRQIYG